MCQRNFYGENVKSKVTLIILGGKLRNKIACINSRVKEHTWEITALNIWKVIDSFFWVESLTADMQIVLVLLFVITLSKKILRNAIFCTLIFSFQNALKLSIFLLLFAPYLVTIHVPFLNETIPQDKF